MNHSNKIYSLLEKSVTTYPDNQFYTDHMGNTLTYKSFMENVLDKQELLIGLGIHEGENIVIIDSNTLNIIELIFATWSLGATATILNPELIKSDQVKLCEQLNPKVVFYENDFRVLPTSYNLKTQYPDSCLITFSSGTSSNPKGIIHSENGLIYNSEQIAGYLNLTQKDRCLLTKSLHHVAAITSSLIPVLIKGASLHTTDKNIVNMLQSITSKKITYIDAVSTVVKYMSHFIKSSKLDLYLEKISINGEHLTVDEWLTIKEVFNKAKIYYSYGLSEAGPRVSCLSEEDFNSKRGSVGKPLRGVSIKINRLKQEKIGEIFVKSPSVMLGYFNKEKKTKDAIVNSWLRTGDVGYLDDGYLYVLGRKDDMIIRAGQNIFPNEIEEKIKSIPSVQDCIVYGEPDSLNGNTITAVIWIKNPLEKEGVINLCKQSLPKYMVPNKFIFHDGVRDDFEKINRNRYKEISYYETN
ncbi:class I adenylate-forming enzyme family protein [Bacillus infantis]|uniref:class I adenylate-forming enzyme family protein n=1 Tax=Bacillus infantis TaxID=324767 RepID=UPI0020A19A37|nr:class I adenylate-forming enzyme family protein [Bacillus infantis]MCP1161324.1 acyl--CoA ligase [Bacillus infantis]